jgi:acetyl esterase/lipase
MLRTTSEPAISTSGTPSDVKPEVEEEYVNPLDNSSRWYLATKAFTIRQGANIAFGLQHMASPAAPGATKTIWLDSTIGAWTGKKVIQVDIWIPNSKPEKTELDQRPGIINFHGGGFVIGQGTDDARWAAAAMAELDAVVFSVNYRLAPGYPFPKPVEDCVDAIIQLISRAPGFGVDPDRIVISGFSAGANLALASWLVLQDQQRWNYHLPVTSPPRFVGLVLFYPVLDWTIGRARKRATCVRPDMALSSTLTDLFDASYIYPPIPREARDDWRLSPGLMSDELLDKLPPIHLCLCEWDMLLAEGLTFAERLKLRNKVISVRVVTQEKHGWDKPPPFTPKESVGTEYSEALKSVNGWFEDVQAKLPVDDLRRASMVRATTTT